jgi:hypothetical protein
MNLLGTQLSKLNIFIGLLGVLPQVLLMPGRNIGEKSFKATGMLKVINAHWVLTIRK